MLKRPFVSKSDGFKNNLIWGFPYELVTHWETNSAQYALDCRRKPLKIKNPPGASFSDTALQWNIPNILLSNFKLPVSEKLDQPLVPALRGGDLFLPNTLKSPLNWLKFTKEILGESPQNPGRPLSSDPGSATDSSVLIRLEKWPGRFLKLNHFQCFISLNFHLDKHKWFCWHPLYNTDIVWYSINKTTIGWAWCLI